MTVQTHTLPNGFRIVTEHMPGLKSASIGIWVKAGCRHERKDQNGIAHFLEHMAFKGTKTRSALDIAESLENVGGYLNAYTSREMTAYYARVLQEDVPLALDVISDIVLNPIFDPSELELERGVILQEIGMVLDTPDEIIFDWLQETAYPDQPMGRPILGPSENVRGFSRDSFEDFVGHHYVPGEMILSAAGAVDHDAIVKDAERLFGGLDRTRTSLVEKSRYQGGDRREIRDLEQAHFALSLQAPAYLDDAFHTAQIHALVLGGGASSRLFQEAREKRGLCYTIMAQTGAFEDSGMLTIYAGTGADQIAELTTLTLDELKRVAGDLAQPELDRARAQMKAGLLMGQESPSQRCERLARMLAIWDRVPSLDETVAKIDAVTLAQVQNFSAAVTSETPAVALYGPVSGAPDYDTIAGRLVA